MKIYNTMSGRKEDFKTVEQGKVKMYSCGPTVYKNFNMANARPFIIFDVLRNYLEYIGYDVTFVQNFTDIDDKIVKKAKEEGITPMDIADRYIDEYFKDAKALGIKKADFHPRSTDHIEDTINFIKVLIDKGFAYIIDNDVYFEVAKFEDYGKLSNKNLEDLISNARTDKNDKRRSPIDFALWKGTKEGEMSWDSPWGKGKPGWHIECSVISNKFLGDAIDIHSGGQDLIFPHHENEIAQSEAYSSCSFANYWVHNAYINADAMKMIRSMGKFFVVRDVLKEYEGDVIRFLILSAHYRSPIHYCRELLTQAQQSLDRIKNCKSTLNFMLNKASEPSLSESEKENIACIQKFKTNFIEKMDDDLNTADAITTIFDLVKFANTQINEKSSKEFIQLTLDMLNELTSVLNIAFESKNENENEEDIAKIESLIEERTMAKKEKNFAKADEIRNQLLLIGIVIKDTRQGTQWLRV